ncbi:YbhB/YbcL family Raf kinase inhibitor-like protein [candidate division KSB3 bacterium]|uniref:YbhB/YbcL family Raf kinase inhibitor-like protein n=1 Tax=candidate division KSB3 bacterium TaxID=2044937 RepID=A0A9D5Q6W7_9BACT|nr:YbhB/YbcL family Raf kinase inhibitor-like protein [candidate division KSB3 bacterium]MBD3325321.1 YbhB/YbcL family Raf kinase inhibitor-like protein [candidate division KSB3 bacterium]
MQIQLRSSAFTQGGMIPAKYTCDGQNISPPLEWDAVPGGTESLALIMDDPDAPGGTWVHWVLFNLPPDTKRLSEDLPPQEELAHGACHGINDFQKIGYGGPCPPKDTHNYYFKLYALDTKLDTPPGITKAQLVEQIEDYTLAVGTLIGQYQRQ